MRRVKVRRPSFSEVEADVLLEAAKRAEVWQVLCGDSGHYRVGIYSPALESASDVEELERHDCPELFLLLRGALTLVLSDEKGGTRQLPLEQGRPVLVKAPHSGFCPLGAHQGAALVVERDELETEYRPVADWR